ncbi:MAG: transglutaminase-like domain-containing protein [bacterium]
MEGHISEKYTNPTENIVENIKAEPTECLGWVIDYISDINLPRITVDREKNRIEVNLINNKDSNEALRLGVLSVAKEIAFSDVIRGGNTKEILDLFSENPDFFNEILRLTGARIISERDPQIAQKIMNSAKYSGSSITEFKSACAEYLATGVFPPTTEAVSSEIAKLPISPKTREHILSALTSEKVSIERKKDYYNRFILPAFERLKDIDRDLGLSAGESFQPSTDDNMENSELSEDQIEQKVAPFFGGYFRENVFDGVDWPNMRVVAGNITSQKILQAEQDDMNKKDISKRYTFSGKNGQSLTGGQLSAPLPARASVLAESISEGIIIRQTDKGIYTIEAKEPTQDISPEYSFEFILSKEYLDWQKMKPTEEETTIPESVIKTFSKESMDFLESLKLSKIIDSAKVGQIARRVQKNIEYVNDSSVGTSLSLAGEKYFTELENTKKGDCDVCNFYALAQIRSLGIPCRMITGFYVKKNSKFPFAPLAGTKHAWLEWWNKDSGVWERIDATPPKKEDEDAKEEKEDEDKSGGLGNQMDITVSEPKTVPDESDDDPWSVPLEQSDLERLKEKINEAVSKSGEISEAERVAKTFQEIYGVTPERWTALQKFVESVSKEKIKKSATVEKKSDSTVSKEWQHIFNLLLVAYRLPNKPNRSMTRQSQGEDLVDPVSAGIDIITGSEDPFGYEKNIRRQKTEKLPIKFSNDFLLDVTASMEAQNNEGKSLLELERRFVVSSLYEGYRLNEKIKQHSADLGSVPSVSNHILSIHGGMQWSEILKNQPMELKDLVKVDDVFKKTTHGAGAMADAIESYLETLKNDTSTIKALKSKEMVKTLTIITDGNLWCSACGKESCSYQLHGPILDRVQKALSETRELGVIINTIGFSDKSSAVTELFKVPNDPFSALVVEDLSSALMAHHGQILRAMDPVIRSAHTKLGSINI